MSGEPPKPKRHLTQKYNMKAIHALTNMEEEFLADLAALYGCEEDDLPITVDLIEIYNESASNRANHIRSLLSGCPNDASQLIDKTVERMAKLDAEGKDDA